MSVKNPTITVYTFAVFALLATSLFLPAVSAAEPTPDYNNKIPES